MHKIDIRTAGLSGLTVMFAGTLPAQGQSEALAPAPALAPKSSSYSQSFGVADVKGQLRLYGGIKRGDGASDDVHDSRLLAQQERQARANRQKAKNRGLKVLDLKAYGGLAADVRFFGGDLLEVAAIEYSKKLARKASGRGENGRPRSNAVASRQEANDRDPQTVERVVRVCGFTIALDDQGPPSSGAKAGARRKDKIPPKNLLPRDVRVQFMVGPVPVLVRANAGVGAGLEISPGAVDMDGYPTFEAVLNAYLNGWVAAGVGGGCRLCSVSAGVRSDLRLLDTSTGFRLNLGTGASELGVKFQAAALKLIAFARFDVWFWAWKWHRVSKRYQRLLREWSSEAHVETIPLT